jgi:holo-[acyl-carrier protein] synthase
MIYGIGTDIADISRIRAAYERQGERFVARILGPNEQMVWRDRSNRWADRGLRFLATRFSAKEAFSKAIGLGMRMPMAWSRCEILNNPSGRPSIELNNDLKTWFDALSLRAWVTISDEANYAVSFVVVERDAQPHLSSF